MAFPSHFLDELRDRLSLVAFVGRRVKLIRRGREHTGLCPFHNEKSPSFTVNEDKGFFHCFGCGAHGDLITFEMRTGNLTFMEAVERLALEAGMEMPELSPRDQEREEQKGSLLDAMEAACLFFQDQLRTPAGREALGYLQRREVSEQAIARFRLGYAPDSRDALKRALMSTALPESLLLESGLLIKPDNGTTYDRFRGRIIFPVCDRKGRVIAFGGRIMGDGQPKYLNSPDTPLFHKGSILYNQSQALAAARKVGTLILCEGYMDVIALDGGGFSHAVAPLGTALTEQQLENAWKMAAEPILCFDGDAAGQRAATRAAERALPLLKPGHSLRFAILPPAEDPDSLIKTQGPAAMSRVLEQSAPLVEILWRSLTAGRTLDTPERQAALEQDVLALAGTITDATVQDYYRRDFKDRLWQLFRTRGRFEKNSQKFSKRSGRKEAQSLQAISGVPGLPLPPPLSGRTLRQEQILLTVLSTHPGLIEQVGERLGMVSFVNNDLDKLRQELLKHFGSSVTLDSHTLALHLQPSGMFDILESLLDGTVYTHAPYARPDVPDDVALRGWEHVFRLYLQKDLDASLGTAEQQLARDTSDRNVRMLTALKLQVLSIENEGLDMKDDDSPS